VTQVLPRGVEAASDGVDGARPRVALARDELLQHAERARRAPLRLVRERATEARDVREARALGEIATELHLRVRALLQDAEELQHHDLAEHQARVGLLRRADVRRQLLAPALPGAPTPERLVHQLGK